MSPPDLNKRIGPALLRRWPIPLKAGSKDARGTVLVVAGSPHLAGTVVLSATSALRAGAGKLQIATAPEIVPHIGTAIPEAMVFGFDDAPAHAERADAVVFGPGLEPSEATASLLRNLLKRSRARFLIDAGALSVLASDPQLLRHAAHLPVLTPHHGELAAMIGGRREDADGDPIAQLRRALEKFDAAIALKGRSTFVAAAGTPIYENIAGHDGLATSGSGDTLAGIAGGLLARGAEPLQAAVWAVYVHAAAGKALGTRIGIGFLAREIPSEVPRILRNLER